MSALFSPGEGAARSRSGVGGLPRRFRARCAGPHPPRLRRSSLSRLRERVGVRGFTLALPLLLAACAATQSPAAVQPGSPGFLLGLWHGFIFPVAWIVSLFTDKVAIYAVPNNGGWYDFGFVLGIMVFGVGAKGGHSITVHRR